MENFNDEVEVKKETIFEFENEQSLNTDAGQFKAFGNDLLDFHNLYRAVKSGRNRIFCKSCHRENRSCKCCIRPAHLCIDSPSKCAGCHQYFTNGNKTCAGDSDFVKCRSLEVDASCSSAASISRSDRVTDQLLEFHHLNRKKNGKFSCVSCLVFSIRCKCCIRPAVTSKLTFENKTKCAGCNEYIEKGKKPCSEQSQSLKCRQLENTISKRKFGVSFMKDGTLTDTTTSTRLRRSSRKSDNLTDSTPNTTDAESGLQIVSDWTTLILKYWPEPIFSRLNSPFRNRKRSQYRHRS